MKGLISLLANYSVLGHVYFYQMKCARVGSVSCIILELVRFFVFEQVSSIRYFLHELTCASREDSNKSEHVHSLSKISVFILKKILGPLTIHGTPF